MIIINLAWWMDGKGPRRKRMQRKKIRVHPESHAMHYYCHYIVVVHLPCVFIYLRAHTHGDQDKQTNRQMHHPCFPSHRRRRRVANHRLYTRNGMASKPIINQPTRTMMHEQRCNIPACSTLGMTIDVRTRPNERASGKREPKPKGTKRVIQLSAIEIPLQQQQTQPKQSGEQAQPSKRILTECSVAFACESVHCACWPWGTNSATIAPPTACSHQFPWLCAIVSPAWQPPCQCWSPPPPLDAVLLSIRQSNLIGTEVLVFKGKIHSRETCQMFRYWQYHIFCWTILDWVHWCRSLKKLGKKC